MPSDPQYAQILAQLAQWANGHDHFGRAISQEQQERAMMEYTRLKAAEAERETSQARLALETRQADLEVQKAQMAAHVELQKIEIEKARVVVDALRIMVEGGEAAQALQPMFDAFSRRLLESSPADLPRLLPALEDAKK